jgi:hypothetical protein
MPVLRWLAAFSIASLAGITCASTLTFSGKLNDPGNSALVWSDLSAALFGDDFAIANNVALYSLNVTQAGTVKFDSSGFAAGGLDPYFTLFSGTGNSALFLDSNYYTTGADFHLSEFLGIGLYTLALGVNANMSFAENFGTGSLGDGFIQLGVPDELGDYSYGFTVTLADDGGGGSVPEPHILSLVAVALLCATAMRRKARG